MGATAENRTQSWMEDRSGPYVYSDVSPIVVSRALLSTLHSNPFKNNNLVCYFL